MNQFFKKYLFEKHILVADSHKEESNRFEVVYSLANLFAIRIVDGFDLAEKYMISYVSELLGENVPDPFYKGFPDSVRELSPNELLFDQLLHYSITYGMGNFSEPGHSAFEEDFERIAFKEEVEPKDFTIVSEDEAGKLIQEAVDQLLESTRPLNNNQYDLVCAYVGENDYAPEHIASKAVATRLAVDFRDIRFAGGFMLSDTIRVLDELSYRIYENENLRQLNLRNQDRVFITTLIDQLMKDETCDIRTCFEKKKVWNGLLHHIHYKPKSELGQEFVDAMRNSGNQSVYAEFERHMEKDEIRAAVDCLIKAKGKTVLLRNLDYIISRCEDVEDIRYVLKKIESKNAIVLIQLMLRYRTHSGDKAARVFRFTNHEKFCVHEETPEEQKKRRSRISEGQAKMLSSVIEENLKNVLKGRIGKTYIEPGMERYALPLQETATQDGYGVLAKGTRLPIPDMKKIRAFTYWEKVNDIDLSVIGLNEDGTQSEFSWRTMYNGQSGPITFSGDETSGYDGGSEYFDIDVELMRKLYPKMRYMVFCDNVYSRGTFDECFCKAGYMLRDKEDSGEIFEPKTIESAFIVTGNSRFCYLFALDLQKNEFIWLNVCRDSYLNIAGESSLNAVRNYLMMTEVINMRSFFEMMADEIVDEPKDADIVVTDKSVKASKKADHQPEIIREYDYDKMLSLMNG